MKAFKKLDSLLENNPNIEYSTFRQDYLMIKSSGLSKGILSLSLDKHPSLFYDFIEVENNLENYVYVSSNFYENNNLDLKQSLTLFNIQEMIENIYLLKLILFLYRVHLLVICLFLTKMIDFYFTQIPFNIIC